MGKMIRRILLGVAVVLGVSAGLIAAFSNHGYVTTPSMYPTIPPGSLIFIHKQSQYRLGEVIEFHGGGLDYVHRIIKIAPDGDITTKGDNPENAPDLFATPTTAADVMGAVYLAPRWLGFPELIAHHPGYGLSWLRAELGWVGKAVVIAASGLVAFVAIGRRRSESGLGSGPDEPPADEARTGEAEADQAPTLIPALVPSTSPEC